MMLQCTAMRDSMSPDVPCPPLVSRSPHPSTYFAPAGRDAHGEFARKAAVVESVPMLQQAIDAMPNMVLILNENRQIVAANKALLAATGAMIADVAEKRPGEGVGCIRVKEGPDGCGTSRHCVTCGAVNAILQCQERQERVARECRILVESADGVVPMDLKVTATPFAVGSDRFILAAIEDVSQSKRLAVLQRTFFHDVLNIAGCLRGYADMLASDGVEDLDSLETIGCLSQQLIESIRAQRDLTHAEAGDLELHVETLHARAVLDELRVQYRRHEVSTDRTVALGSVWEGTLATDRQLLQRVLGNMVKNALEATARGGTVTVACQERAEGVEFSVHNAEVMPEEVQLQVFQRSFSTKGQAGRGIGTYSMKLLGERYLQGKVDFVSDPATGTVFTLTVPKEVR